MRNALALVLALSLSWITTGYACQMGERTLADCCCPQDGHRDAVSETTSQSAPSLDASTCCDLLAASAADAKWPGFTATPALLDLPDLLGPSAFSRPRAAGGVHAADVKRQQTSVAGFGSRTYLLTARLRL